MSTNTVRGTISGLGHRANPLFATGIVLTTVVAVTYGLGFASVRALTYIHVMAGLLWTGIDIFIGGVIGPVVGGMDEESSAAFFSRFTPKTAFVLPATAVTSIATGLTLAERVGLFPHAGPWLALFTAANLIPVLVLLGYRLDVYDDRRWQLTFTVVTAGSLAWVAATIGSFAMTNHAVVAALLIVTLLSVQGFGFLFPGELRMYREMQREDPDPGVIAAIGRQNAKLGGIQGLFQLVLIGVMVSLRFGGF